MEQSIPCREKPLPGADSSVENPGGARRDPPGKIPGTGAAGKRKECIITIAEYTEKPERKFI